MLLKAVGPAQNVSLNIIVGRTGDDVTIEYVTPNSNQPNTYGNQVYLWQAEDMVPWGEDPLKHQAVDGLTRQGSFVFEGLEMRSKSYILGYAVGGTTDSWPKYGNVCATACLPKGIITDSDPSLSILYFSTQIYPQVAGDTLNVSYEVTPGVQPKTNGAWMALWRSKTNPYKAPNYDYWVPISKDDDAGSESFSGVKLVAGKTYTLAFMMSGWAEKIEEKKWCQTAIAAVSTFKID